MTNEEREALARRQGLTVTHPDTRVVDHITTILLMLSARNLNQSAAFSAHEPVEKFRSIHR